MELRILFPFINNVALLLTSSNIQEVFGTKTPTTKTAYSLRYAHIAHYIETP
jgi:hypothetical protein